MMQPLRLFQQFGEGGHLFFAEGKSFAHFFVPRTPLADVVFWRSAVPADQVQFFRPTFCGCGQDAEFFDDFKCDVCHVVFPSFPTLIIKPHRLVLSSINIAEAHFCVKYFNGGVVFDKKTEPLSIRLRSDFSHSVLLCSPAELHTVQNNAMGDFGLQRIGNAAIFFFTQVDCAPDSFRVNIAVHYESDMDSDKTFG